MTLRLLRRSLILILLSGLGLTACAGTGAPTSGSPAAAGASTLDFSTATVDGGQFDGASLQGRDAVLWFWASWCSVCAAESGTVREFSEQVPAGVTVLGVAGLGSPPDDSVAFVDRHSIGDITHLYDGDGSLWQRFGVTRQPSFVFLRADGTSELVAGRLALDELLQRSARL